MMSVPKVPLLSTDFGGRNRTKLEDLLYSLSLTPMSIYEEKIDENTQKPIKVKKEDRTPIVRIGTFNKPTIFVIAKTNKNGALVNFLLDEIKTIADEKNKWFDHVRFVLVPDVADKDYQFAMNYMQENAETRVTSIVVDFDLPTGEETTIIDTVKEYASANGKEWSLTNDLPKQINLAATVLFNKDGAFKFKLNKVA